MKVFTIESGLVKEGARIDRFTVKGADIEIPAIIVGEEGRGRQLGVLPVHLLDEKYDAWKRGESVAIEFARVGQTKTGRPKLIELTEPETDEKAIVVFRTKIGFRGGNSHTGDREGYFCRACGYFFGLEYHGDRETCPKCGESSFAWEPIQLRFKPFPGEILVKGVIAQGLAGRMGSGEQLVAVMPKGVVFRTGYSGRLYGAPAAHYYVFDGEKILAATWEERMLTELF